MISIVVGMSDSDWAGGQTLRKSTSGGACKIGCYVIKIWSSIHQMIVLSSAEAELYALLKCACQIFGVVNFALDFGIKLNAIVHTDANAILVITQRQGLGTLRQIAIHWLWIQDRVKTGEITTNKVHGNDNLADLFAKHLPIEEIHKHLKPMDFHVEVGKANKSLTIISFEHIAIEDKKDYWIEDFQCFIEVHV